MANMKQHILWLNAHITKKIAQALDPAPLALKRLHTFQVYKNAKKIVHAELGQGVLARASLLAALFHDVARFDQYLLYGTFKDADSFNHGLIGSRIIKKEGCLANEDPKSASLAIAAIALHNRRALPPSLATDARLVTNIVRDADKLDILRVMREHLRKKPYNPTVILGLPDDPDKGNPAVAQAAMRAECGSYGDLLSVNDFRVLLGSWLFSMNFASSREIFLQAGHALELVQALPDNAAYGEVKKYLLDTYASANFQPMSEIR